MKAKDRIAKHQPVFVIQFPNLGFLKNDQGHWGMGKSGLPTATGMFPSLLAARNTLNTAIGFWEKLSQERHSDGGYVYAPWARREWAELAEIGRTTAMIVQVDFTPVG